MFDKFRKITFFPKNSEYQSSDFLQILASHWVRYAKNLITTMNNEEELFLEGFADMLEFFQIQPLYIQILIIAFLSACTVGLVIFSYYCIKVIVTFFIKIMKGLFKVGEVAIKRIPMMTDELTKKNSVATPVNNQNMPTDFNTTNKKPNKVKDMNVSKIAYHCTNCGKEFSEKMMRTIMNNEKVFCEYCGQGFVVEK
jgi:DNA-directed RNA polymerase subunit RPC12/RpoP